ncbi:TetR/AcrR family transcriptional regulator [Acetobacter fallax]|uniref:TetR family transcriptional regulator n=1 Tax=Acetobacter fallax TaxID=1737473 RepID=A0ABX0K5F3_9PROT|nr:TetR/AcrR family transcriptional regulator [Acetobacter fallax]NHO31612.1 TetR family transcriptional regulator [Acetobacter fallax]NHO35171.1 TetR family transcriptional regulator [Acetobacter fallax]
MEDDDQFDTTLLASAMSLAASKGWRHISMPEIARNAGLDIGEVRTRYPFKTSVLLLLGRLADRSALVDDGSLSTPREALFDLLMRRFDVFQQYREGVLAVLRGLPFDPALAIVLGVATMDSMSWIAGAAGIETSGLQGALRIQGVTALWTHTLRAWEKDDSEDLGTTMAALEQGLDRAERMGLFPAANPPALPTEEPVTDNLPENDGLDTSFVE